MRRNKNGFPSSAAIILAVGVGLGACVVEQAPASSSAYSTDYGQDDACREAEDGFYDCEYGGANQTDDCKKDMVASWFARECCAQGSYAYCECHRGTVGVMPACSDPDGEHDVCVTPQGEYQLDEPLPCGSSCRYCF